MLILTSLMMDSALRIRLRELEFNLSKIGRGFASGNGSELILQYRFLRDQSIDALVLEARNQIAMTTNENPQLEMEKNFFRFLDFGTVMLLNGFSFLTGSSMVQGIQSDATAKVIREAYFQERIKNYSAATDFYQQAIEESGFASDRNLVYYAKLHRGFCYAMLSDFDRSLLDYDDVIGARTHYSETARELRRLLLRSRKKAEEIEKQKLGPDQIRNYYLAALFKPSIETANKYLKTKVSKASKQKAIFYRARSYEELGNLKAAAKGYSELINQNSKIGIKANRRLYMVGAFLANDPAIRDKARNSKTGKKDKKFYKKLISYARGAVKLIAANIGSTPQKNTPDPVEENDDISSKKMASNTGGKSSPKVINKPKTKAELISRFKAAKNKAQKIQILKTYDKLDGVILKDGQILLGRIIEKQADKIKMASVLGVVAIPNSDVHTLYKVDSKKAFK